MRFILENWASKLRECTAIARSTRISKISGLNRTSEGYQAMGEENTDRVFIALHVNRKNSETSAVGGHHE